jgi:hypothetical protein
MSTIEVKHRLESARDHVAAVIADAHGQFPDGFYTELGTVCDTLQRHIVSAKQRQLAEERAGLDD